MTIDPQPLPEHTTSAPAATASGAACRWWAAPLVVFAAFGLIVLSPQLGHEPNQAVTVTIGAFGVLFVMVRRGAWPKVGDDPGRWIVHFFAVLGVFWCLAVHVPFGRWLSRPILLPAAAGQADAIVVLASGFYEQGDPTFAGLQRFLHGVKLFRDGRAPKIFFSTSSFVDETTGRREADWVASLAALLNLPAGKFEIVREGLTTRDESQVFARILPPQGIRTILLVTNGPHIRRATRVFTKAGLSVLPAPVQRPESVDSACDSTYALLNYAMHELIGLVVYRMRGNIDEL